MSVNNVLRVSLHRECFTGTGWPINENGAVLAIYEGVAKHLTFHLREHL